jgi:hypothetical protein
MLLAVSVQMMLSVVHQEAHHQVLVALMKLCVAITVVLLSVVDAVLQIQIYVKVIQPVHPVDHHRAALQADHQVVSQGLHVLINCNVFLWEVHVLLVQDVMELIAHVVVGPVAHQGVLVHALPAHLV